MAILFEKTKNFHGITLQKLDYLEDITAF